MGDRGRKIEVIYLRIDQRRIRAVQKAALTLDWHSYCRGGISNRRKLLLFTSVLRCAALRFRAQLLPDPYGFLEEVVQCEMWVLF